MKSMNNEQLKKLVNDKIKMAMQDRECHSVLRREATTEVGFKIHDMAIDKVTSHIIDLEQILKALEV